MTSDRRSGSRQNGRRGRFSGGGRAPDEVRPGRRDGPPPTRVLPPLPTDVAALPALPGAFEEALDAGLRELHIELTTAARGQLAAHVRLLLAWNPSINLTAITDPAQVAVRHVIDSLSAVPLVSAAGVVSEVPEVAAHADRLRIADLGSGGGFPGIPLAVAFPLSQVTLVESVGKKARFLEAAIEVTGLRPRVDVRQARAEALGGREEPAGREGWDVVTARAVGSLPDLVELALPALNLGGRLVAWKGPSIDAELGAARRAAHALGGAEPVVNEVMARGLEGHRLVVVSKLSRTPPGYPRDPARRRAQPWLPRP